MLKTRGFNHIDLGTKDMEATRTFYEGVLGFPLVRADLVDIVGKGRMKHFSWSTGPCTATPVALQMLLDAASITSPSTPRPRPISSALCHLVRAFVAEDAVPQVRFRREGRRKIQIEETARP